MISLERFFVFRKLYEIGWHTWSLKEGNRNSHDDSNNKCDMKVNERHVIEKVVHVKCQFSNHNSVYYFLPVALYIFIIISGC